MVQWINLMCPVYYFIFSQTKLKREFVFNFALFVSLKYYVISVKCPYTPLYNRRIVDFYKLTY